MILLRISWKLLLMLSTSVVFGAIFGSLLTLLAGGLHYYFSWIPAFGWWACFIIPFALCLIIETFASGLAGEPSEEFFIKRGESEV